MTMWNYVAKQLILGLPNVYGLLDLKLSHLDAMHCYATFLPVICIHNILDGMALTYQIKLRSKFYAQILH